MFLLPLPPASGSHSGGISAGGRVGGRDESRRGRVFRAGGAWEAGREGLCTWRARATARQHAATAEHRAPVQLPAAGCAKLLEAQRPPGAHPQASASPHAQAPTRVVRRPAAGVELGAVLHDPPARKFQIRPSKAAPCIISRQRACSSMLSATIRVRTRIQRTMAARARGWARPCRAQSRRRQPRKQPARSRGPGRNSWPSHACSQQPTATRCRPPTLSALGCPPGTAAWSLPG